MTDYLVVVMRGHAIMNRKRAVQAVPHQAVITQQHLWWLVCCP